MSWFTNCQESACGQTNLEVFC